MTDSWEPYPIMPSIFSFLPLLVKLQRKCIWMRSCLHFIRARFISTLAENIHGFTHPTELIMGFIRVGLWYPLSKNYSIYAAGDRGSLGDNGIVLFWEFREWHLDLIGMNLILQHILYINILFHLSQLITSIAFGLIHEKQFPCNSCLQLVWKFSLFVLTRTNYFWLRLYKRK